MAISLIEVLMGMQDVYTTMQNIEKHGDEQSADLLKDTWIKLKKETMLNHNQQYAFNILQDVLKKKGSNYSSLMRNQIFKAADAMKIKLPSAMFASIDRVSNKYMEKHATNLPEPKPWLVPIPWEEAALQVSTNLDLLTRAGCKIKKIQSKAQNYVLLSYKGNPFYLSVSRRMPNMIGNLWSEPDEVKGVCSKLPRLFSIFAVQDLDNLMQKNVSDLVKKVYADKWQQLLALGIIESWMSLKGF